MRESREALAKRETYHVSRSREAQGFNGILRDISHWIVTLDRGDAPLEPSQRIWAEISRSRAGKRMVPFDASLSPLSGVITRRCPHLPDTASIPGKEALCAHNGITFS